MRDEFDVGPEREYAIRAGAYEAAAFGDAEITGEIDGEHVFRQTDAGRQRANQIIDNMMVTHGLNAGHALALALGIDDEMGEALVTKRLQDIHSVE